MCARVRSHRCIAWAVWHGACSEAGPGAQGEYGGTEAREGSWHSLKTHNHTPPHPGDREGTQMCPLDSFSFMPGRDLLSGVGGGRRAPPSAGLFVTVGAVLFPLW